MAAISPELRSTFWVEYLKKNRLRLSCKRLPPGLVAYGNLWLRQIAGRRLLKLHRHWRAQNARWRPVSKPTPVSP